MGQEHGKGKEDEKEKEKEKDREKEKGVQEENERLRNEEAKLLRKIWELIGEGGQSKSALANFAALVELWTSSK